MDAQPYSGKEKKLVIAIDVGTTFSGVSYALLDPGVVPQIQPVTQFVGQREPRSDSKVPSIVCYDQDETVVAAGAETDLEMNHELAEMDNVIRVEWFKLHLRPPHLALRQEFEIQKLRWLPKNKTPVQVFGDFLKYLFESTKKYIMDSETWSWSSVKKNIYFVPSHPNGWEGKQQSQLRKAAIAAGLVDKSEASERISFVPEGEASLHFCLNKNPNLHNERDGILVVDCGGGTIDVSAYSQTTRGRFKEITPPESLFQGSIFITCRAKKFLEQKLQDSKYGSEHEIEAMASSFDKVTKCTFDSPNTACYVKFGGLNYIDSKFGIRSGSVKILGTEMASLFEPALQDIMQLIDDQRSKATITIKTVLVVGGFARSNYLFSQLSARFIRGVSIIRPDTTHLNKAAADGAVSYFLNHCVVARVSKYSYGLDFHILFDPTNPEHARRKKTKYTLPNGKASIPGRFETILQKGTTVSEEMQFRETYCEQLTPVEFSQLMEYPTFLKCYRGEAENPPEWIDLESDSFQNACRITTDMTSVKRNIRPAYDPLAKKHYYPFDYEVVILFGLTELKAYITWKENGIEKRSDASIVYDD